MPILPFPMSSSPGRLPGEGEGRLINCRAEKDGESVYIRRLPAVVSSGIASGFTVPRGMLDVGGTVYAVFSGGGVTIAPNGTKTNLSGSIPGTDGVTIARNNRVTSGASTPDVVAVRSSGGAYKLSGGIATYPDADLPATANSVSFLGGFFVFTIADGRIFASELNSTAINALSFATAESSPDGLLRGIVSGNMFYAMGSSSIEPWQNVGNSPFPLARHATTIPVGLLTTMAVAGGQDEWDLPPIFVAQDGTVRVLNGFETQPVSNAAVERFIAASDKATLEAMVYTRPNQPMWVLTSNLGTWELNVATGQWNERRSAGIENWRASHAVKQNGRWLFGDRQSGDLLQFSDTTFDAVTAETGPLKQFPQRMVVPRVYVDLASSVDVAVDLSWSHDGAKTWSTPVQRTAQPGRKAPVSVGPLGLSTHHGMRLRINVSSTTQDVSIMGANVPEPQARAA